MRKGRWLRWLAAGFGIAAVVAVALAPSWRSYYLPRRTVRVIEDVPYVDGSAQPRHRLDLYLPGPGRAPSPVPGPVVVFVHGGFWRPMDRRLLQPITGLFGGVGVALANQGVATAVIGYRQVEDGATVEDALADVARAVRYVADHVGAHGGDPGRLVLVGHSAGGFLTALLALSPEPLERAGVPAGRVRGFVSLGGTYDLPGLLPALPQALAAAVRRSAGDVGAAGPEETLLRLSPARRVRPGHAPLLLVAGTKETPVLLAQQRSMADALRKAGGDAESLEVPGAGHMDLVMHLSDPDDAVRTALLRFVARAAP